jgi:hypothetical protein
MLATWLRRKSFSDDAAGGLTRKVRRLEHLA